MSEINSINVITSTQEPIRQASFGKPLIVGVSSRGEYLEKDVLSGNAGIKWRATASGPQNIKVAYANGGASQALSVVRTGTGSKSNPYLISVNLATDIDGNPISTTAEIKIAAETVENVAGGTGIVSVSLIGDGTGVAMIFAASSLVAVVTPSQDYLEITDPAQLLTEGYLSDDPEYLLAVSLFSQTPKISVAAVYQVPSWEEAPAKLAELRNSGKDDWYWVLATTREKSEILPLAAYVNSLTKVGVFATADQTIANPVGGAPETQERCVYLVSTKAEDYPDAAWVGKCAPEPIGSVAWDSKVLSGQSNSGVTMAEQTTLFAANINLLREMGGKVVTWEGKTRSGQYIDVLNGRDYLQARLIEAWHFLKIGSKKLEMTAQGLGRVEAALREVLRDCGRRGIIAAVFTETDRTRSNMGDYQYKLSIPSVDDLPANDRAARRVSGIKGTARIGGGINYLDVSIEMTV